MKTLKTKVESKKPIYEIEVNDVFYLYAVGLQWIAISTKPDSQWGQLPEWCRVCFAVPTPDDFQFTDRYSFFPVEHIECFVHRVIKDEIHEQRKTHESQAGNNKQLAMRPGQPGQKAALSNTGRKGRKKIATSLFNESDNGAAK